jgi:hypothetical protein
MMNSFDPQQVMRVKRKLKNPDTFERVKGIVKTLTKADLQKPSTVRSFIKRLSSVLNESFSNSQTEHLAHWIIAQKIDPKNKWQLLKLWSMFR